ncbi:MAG: hypothetical protein GY722_28380 [bacterium]|nr:hypothetical protein [bacterium]
MSRRTTVSLLFAATTLVAFAAVASAGGGNSQLTGTWEILVTDGPRALATFNKGGTSTLVATVGANSPNLGVWKKEGPHTFVNRFIGYQFDAGGNLSAIGETITVIELSQDGQTYAAESTVEVRLPDGTLIATIPFSSTATRLTID